MKEINVQTKNLLFLSFISIVATFFVAAFGYIVFENKYPSIIGIWNQWDTKWYLRIAGLGYENLGEGRLSITFFPLYPWLIRLVTVFFKDYLTSAIVISNIFYIFASIFFYKLVRVDFSGEIALDHGATAYKNSNYIKGQVNQRSKLIDSLKESGENLLTLPKITTRGGEPLQGSEFIQKYIYISDITEDPKYWINTCFAQAVGVKEVNLSQ